MKCSFCHCDMDQAKPGYRYLVVEVKEVEYGEYCYIQGTNDKAVLCCKECFEGFMAGRGFGW